MAHQCGANHILAHIWWRGLRCSSRSQGLGLARVRRGGHLAGSRAAARARRKAARVQCGCSAHSCHRDPQGGQSDAAETGDRHLRLGPKCIHDASPQGVGGGWGDGADHSLRAASRRRHVGSPVLRRQHSVLAIHSGRKQ